jgi:isopenicillin-N epimerase
MSHDPTSSAAYPTSTHADRRPLPAGSDFARFWRLDPSIAYLNHGSFGATPIAVLEAQDRHRARMEGEAIRYFVTELDGMLDAARAELAAFVYCPANDLAFVTNATVGVATALENAANNGILRRGDKVIASPHEYPACMNNLRRICARVGAEIVMADVPFPLTHPDEIVEAIVRYATRANNVRLALVSHVTSSSGLVLPIAKIVSELKSRGVETVVDGAHAPGFTDVDLTSLGAAYYTANCHKWICSPKGSAMLYVRPDLQRNFRPLVLSNFAEKPKPGRSHFLTEFDYIGTADHSALFCIADALRFMGTIVARGAGAGIAGAAGIPSPTPAEIRAGFVELRRRNRELVIASRNVLCAALSVEPPAPDSMIASLSTIFLPPHDADRHARVMSRATKYHDALQDALVEKHRIQVPVWSVSGRPERLFRISAQIYNAPGQYEYLAHALKRELDAERAM